MITVTYSDGSKFFYKNVQEAQEGIGSVVFGSNFAATVDDIDSDDGKEYAASWKVELEVTGGED